MVDILIRDGRIARCIDHDDSRNEPPDNIETIIDGHQKLVIPGLVNAHYHSHDVMARGLFEDLPLEVWIALAIPTAGRTLTKREIRVRTLLGAVECLLSGITTLQDMVACGPGFEEHVESIQDAYREVGIRCVLSLQFGNRAPLDTLPPLREALPESLHHLMLSPQPDARRILEFIEAPLRRERHRRLTWALAPGSPQRCTPELLEQVAALAARYDLPVFTHVNETKLQAILARGECARFGGSWVGYLQATGLLNSRLGMAHGIWLDDREIDLIAEAGAAVVTNPTSNLKLKAGVAPLRRLQSAGVTLGLGCDNTSAGDAQNLFQVMKLVCTMNAAKGPDESRLTAERVFEYATLGGARVLAMEREIGSIEVGKAADLTLLDLTDPAYIPLNHAVRQIVYSECGRAVHTVIVDGNIVVENGRLTTIDRQTLREEAEDMAKAFCKDYSDQAARMAPVIPFISHTVRRIGRLPLAHNRWLSADDAPAPC
jgi:guanine deaminase